MHRDLETGRALIVSEQSIAEAKREVVHRSRRGHAHGPVPPASRIRLHGRVGAAVDDLHRSRPVSQRVKRGRVLSCRDERVVLHGVGKVLKIRFHPVHDGLGKRIHQGATGGFPSRRGSDHLGEERVVERRNLGSATEPGVDTRSIPFGESDHGDRSRGRTKPVLGIFGAQSCFDGAPRGDKVRDQLVERRQFAGRQLDHPANQVDPVDQLGDPVFDLQSGVHLEERRRLAVRVVEEFHRPGAQVVHRSQQRSRFGVQACADGGRQVRCRALLHDFLVAALQRAVPVPENRDVPGAISERLHFHVAWRGKTAFHEKPRIPELRLRKPLDGLEALLEFSGVVAALHADAAAPRGALQHDRIADCLGRP